MNEVKFPDVVVPLVGYDNNAFSILGRVSAALRNAGYGHAVDDYMKEAMEGNYDHLLRVTCRTVVVE